MVQAGHLYLQALSTDSVCDSIRSQMHQRWGTFQSLVSSDCESFKGLADEYHGLGELDDVAETFVHCRNDLLPFVSSDK